MFAILDQRGGDVGAGESLRQTQGGLPRHGTVLLAVQKTAPDTVMSMAVRSNRLARPSSIRCRLRRIGVSPSSLGTSTTPSARRLCALARVHGVPHQVLGEVGRGGDADQAGDTVGPRQRRQQHDPPAHAGANHNLRTCREAVQDHDSIVTPAAWAGVLESTRRLAVPIHVEAQKSVATARCENRPKRCALVPVRSDARPCRKTTPGLVLPGAEDARS